MVVDVLKHVQNETMGKLLTDNGSPNLSTIRRYPLLLTMLSILDTLSNCGVISICTFVRLFVAKDRDGDKMMTFTEIRQLLDEIKMRTPDEDKDDVAAQIMKEFDVDNDEKITMEEFINGMRKWLDDTKDAMNRRYHSVKSLKNMYKVS